MFWWIWFIVGVSLTIGTSSTWLAQRRVTKRIRSFTPSERARYKLPLFDEGHEFFEYYLRQWFNIPDLQDHRIVADYVLVLFLILQLCWWRVELPTLLAVNGLMYTARALCFMVTPLPCCRLISLQDYTIDHPQEGEGEDDELFARMLEEQQHIPQEVQRLAGLPVRLTKDSDDHFSVLGRWLNIPDRFYISAGVANFLRLERTLRTGLNHHDLVFSGHCTMAISICCHWTVYSSFSVAELCLWWGLAVFMTLWIVAARNHYTLDCVVSWLFVTSFYSVCHSPMHRLLYDVHRFG